jgi:hypothetical protein
MAGMIHGGFYKCSLTKSVPSQYPKHIQFVSYTVKVSNEQTKTRFPDGSGFFIQVMASAGLFSFIF